MVHYSQSFANQYGLHVVHCSAEWISDVAVSTRLENAKGGEGRLKRERGGKQDRNCSLRTKWASQPLEFDVKFDVQSFTKRFVLGCENCARFFGEWPII